MANHKINRTKVKIIVSLNNHVGSKTKEKKKNKKLSIVLMQ